jgi:hypothetical protein
VAAQPRRHYREVIPDEDPPRMTPPPTVTPAAALPDEAIVNTACRPS